MGWINLITLKVKQGKVFAYRKSDAAQISHDELPVTLTWLRPVNGVGKEVSVMGDDHEIAVIENLEQLDQESRKIAESELENNYLISHIRQVLKTSVHIGNRYFDVVTDCGKSSFVVKNPFVCIRHVDVDGLFIRDVVGNLFVIDSISQLDERSKNELNRVL